MYRALWSLRRARACFLRRRLRQESIRYLRQLGIAHLAERRITGETDSLENLGDWVSDLVRLHRLVLKRKPKDVLEFGCGLSTVVMADALRRNEIATGRTGKVHAVETAQAWADKVLDALPEDLGSYVEIKVSDARIAEIDGDLCHFYENLPDVKPQMIYLDGPCVTHVKGDIRGLTFTNGRPPVAADPLLYESTFQPGFVMIVDGRFTNTYFLRRNLKRKYRFHRDRVHRAHRFVLDEKTDTPG